MAFTDTQKLGVSLNTTELAADIASGVSTGHSHKLGSEIFATDGKRYVYAQANEAISASTAVCTVNAGTFLATATGGAYASPATAMAVGDRGWFGAASV